MGVIISRISVKPLKLKTIEPFNGGTTLTRYFWGEKQQMLQLLEIFTWLVFPSNNLSG